MRIGSSLYILELEIMLSVRPKLCPRQNLRPLLVLAFFCFPIDITGAGECVELTALRKISLEMCCIDFYLFENTGNTTGKFVGN
jgi:hypothetical protein